MVGVTRACLSNASSQEQPSVVVSGRRSGLTKINEEFQRIAGNERIGDVHPPTSSDAQCSKVKLQSGVDDDHDGIEHAEHPDKKLHDNQAGMVDISSAMFNACAPCDPLSQQFGGPAAHLSDARVRQNAVTTGKGDDVVKERTSLTPA